MNEGPPRQHDAIDGAGVDPSVVLLSTLILVLLLSSTHEFWLPIIWPY